MKDFGPESFGDIYAERYDVEHDPGTTDESVDFLFQYAEGADTLELAIGTGRIALPLAGRGVKIQGIDGSQKMLDLLNEKPGGSAIATTLGDIADVPVDGNFDFVFLVFNTLFNLTSQAAQIRCFQNVSQRLASGGCFLVETLVPDITTFQRGQSFRTTSVGLDSVSFEAAVHDPVEQRVDFQRIRIEGGEIKLEPLPIRYALPPEIDLMARLSGLTLEDRWGGWDKRPFTSESSMHISVYRKP